MATGKKSAPLAHYLDKQPSAVHERCAEWIKKQTGYADVDLVTVQLVVSLYQQFQRSPENKAGNAEAQKAREAARAERAQKAQERKEAAAARKTAAAEKRAEKAAAKKAAPAKAAAKKAPAKAPAKSAPAKKAAPAKAKPKPRKRTAGSTAAF